MPTMYNSVQAVSEESCWPAKKKLRLFQVEHGKLVM